MKFLTLMEIELKKMIPWIIAVGALMLILTSWNTFNGANRLADEITSALMQDNLTLADYLAVNPAKSLTDFVGATHLLVFVFGAFILFASVFFMWYKEWLGQSKRIYMLLSLQGSRMRIFFSKLCTFLLISFIFYGLVMISLLVNGLLAQAILPSGAMPSLNVANALLLNGVQIVVPITFNGFLYQTLYITAIFSAITVWVFLNRTSKKIIGFIFGMAYCIGLLALQIWTQSLWLFTDERLLVNWGFAIGATALSMGLSWLLLEKKITI